MFKKLASILIEEYFQLILFGISLTGIGILIYFNLSFEPNVFIVSILFIILLLAFIINYYKEDKFLLNILFLSLLFIMFGFLRISFKSKILNTKLIKRTIVYNNIIGRLIGIETFAEYNRLTFDNIKVINKSNELKLNKIRVNFQKNIILPNIGSTIVFSAKLIPPFTPVTKGSFNFRRFAYFEGLSATGRSLGGWNYSTIQIKNTLTDKIIFNIYNLRNKINSVIDKTKKLKNPGVIMSIMTGERYNINEDTINIYKNAGISHLLSISGFHMSLITGFIFFIIRFLLSLSPYISNKYNNKKIACIIAFIISVLYLLISGARLPTIRAFIMSSIVLLSIMLDRSSISMRSIFISAFIILFLYPESIINAGFQMSFIAVIALTKLYEYKNKWILIFESKSFLWKNLNRFLNTVISVFLSSFLIFLYTLPITIYHFNSVSIYSPIGNLLTIPIFTTIVMPSILFSFIFMPLGFASIFLYIADFGISKINYLANIISSFKYSSIPLFALQGWIFFIIVIGIIWISIWKTKIKYLGIILITIGISFYIFLPKPDLLINKHSNIFGISTKNKLYIINLSSYDNINWIAKEWSKYTGQDFQIIPNSNYFIIKNTIIDFINEPITYCTESDITFLTFSKRLFTYCNKYVFDKWYLFKNDGAEIFIDSGLVKFNKIKDWNNRPWK